MTRYRRLAAVWTLLALMAIPSNILAQEAEPSFTTPDWGDYPLLMSQFGELCTMCIAYVRCKEDNPGTSSTEDFAIYYFEIKSFWGQIATIWDYFAKWFDPVTSEKRPALIYRFNDDGNEYASVPTTAYLSREKSRIEIENTWIDRNTADWYAKSNEQIGSCDRMGIPEATYLIAQGKQWHANGQAASR